MTTHSACNTRKPCGLTNDLQHIQQWRVCSLYHATQVPGSSSMMQCQGSPSTSLHTSNSTQKYGPLLPRLFICGIRLSEHGYRLLRPMADRLDKYINARRPSFMQILTVAGCSVVHMTIGLLGILLGGEQAEYSLYSACSPPAHQLLVYMQMYTSSWCACTCTSHM